MLRNKQLTFKRAKRVMNMRKVPAESYKGRVRARQRRALMLNFSQYAQAVPFAAHWEASVGQKLAAIDAACAKSMRANFGLGEDAEGGEGAAAAAAAAADDAVAVEGVGLVGGVGPIPDAYRACGGDAAKLRAVMEEQHRTAMGLAAELGQGG